MNGHTHDAKTNKIAMREKAKATTLYLTTTSRLIEEKKQRQQPYT
jgi:hypothetical protein